MNYYQTGLLHSMLVIIALVKAKFQGLHLFLLPSNCKMILTGLNSGLKLTIKNFLSCCHAGSQLQGYIFIPSHFFLKVNISERQREDAIRSQKETSTIHEPRGASVKVGAGPGGQLGGDQEKVSQVGIWKGDN